MVGAVTFLAAFLAVGLCQGEDLWKQINVVPVCFEGYGNKHGSMTHFGEGKMIGAIKLVYKSGSIRCAHNDAFASRWGCYQHSHPSINSNPLNVIITDTHNKIVFPVEDYFSKGWSRPGLWYYLPFTDSLNSDELVFTNYLDPFYLPKHGQLRIWYGEDLRNWYEGDNVGRVCVDVYIHGL